VPKLNDTPGRLRERAPRLGEHTGDVLAELGLSRAEIDGLRAKGVIQ
jgi:formyl-CoA transferase